MRSFCILISALLYCNKIHAESTTYPPLKLISTSGYGWGFCAELLKVFDNILYFSKDNLRAVEVDWSQEFFPYKNDPYENGWDLFFEPIYFSDKPYDLDKEITHVSDCFYHAIHDQLCIDHWKNYDQYLAYRLRVHEVIKNHLKIKNHILAKADNFFSENMSGYYCIGVHVRFASDHGSEEPNGRSPLEDYIAEIMNLIKKHGRERTRIYLATDSHYVVKQFKKAFPRQMLVSIDTFRTAYQDTPHLIYGHGDYWLEHPEEFHRKKPGYLGGEGVLMDALLLAKCNVLIHATSNVASFVTFYNPHIDSIYLPKIQNTWPCRYEK